jgi:thioredoxin-dependent peroxiredoxin
MSDTYPQVGSTAPDFKLPGSEGKPVELSSLKGKPVVLYFYPRADTPGCTTEACAFRDASADFKKAGAAVLGVSPDPIADVEKFARKFELNFPLLADEDHAVCEAYGVWQEKSMYGKKYFGAARTTFLIDREGRIARVFEKVKPLGHDQQVLEALREVR